MSNERINPRSRNPKEAFGKDEVRMAGGWKETTLGTIGSFSKGCGISKSEAQSGKIPCVRYGEIYTSHSDYVKMYYSHISEDVAASARQLRRGDLLFAGSGETKEEIGKCVAFLDDAEVYAGGDIIILSPKSGNDSLFLGYYLNSRRIVEQKASRGQGDAIVHIGASSLSKIEIQLPPFPEQRAIASALSDVDGYIAALERLIAKKRTIKQGAMQELLTGKRRLPGFGGEWFKIALGQNRVGWLNKESIDPRLTPSELFSEYSMPAFDEGKSPKRVFGSSMQSMRVRISDNALLFNKLNVRQRRIWLVRKCEKNAVCSSEFLPYYSNTFDLSFLFHLLGTDKVTTDFESMSTGTSNSQKRITPCNFLEYEVFLPKSKKEQAAIAAILSNMDAEIDALTAKLDKVRNIKQGMMQELLTGRIRLVAEEPKAVSTAKPVTKVVKQPKREPETTAAHNKAIEDAVILAVVADLYATEQYPLTPFYAQKFPYLLHRHMEGVAQGYHKLAAGPYNAELKYRTALPIAKKNKYVVTRKSKYRETSYEAMLVGDNIAQAKKYFAQWHGDEPLKWLEQFRYIKNRKDELELLSTVDMAMVELRAAKVPITVQAVKEIIQSSAEWEAKLKREIFSDANIARAITWSDQLFGQEGGHDG